MTNLAIIWALFTLIFFCLGVYHLIQSRYEHQKFTDTTTESEYISYYNATAEANETRLNNFTDAFNLYIDKYNKDNKEVNKAAFYGYMVSSLVSIFSMLIELRILPIK